MWWQGSDVNLNNVVVLEYNTENMHVIDHTFYASGDVNEVISVVYDQSHI